MRNSGKIILIVLVVCVAAALFVFKGNRAYQQHQKVIQMEISKEVQQQKFRQEIDNKCKEERRASDAEDQVDYWYKKYQVIYLVDEFDDLSIEAKKQYKESFAKLHEWIPKYRAELEASMEKALVDNNTKAEEECKSQLSWLDEIEAEINGTDSGDMPLFRIRENNKFGFIDKAGAIVIEPQFDEAWDFHEGLAAVKKDGKWGYIDKLGIMVIAPQFYGAGYGVGDFHEGLARIRTDEWVYGYIDRTGKVVIEPQFGTASVFNEGLAAVEKDGKYGYIDKTGKMVVEPQFGAASVFNEGLAVVKKDGKFGYIDKTGKIVIEPQFHGAFSSVFHEGLARIEKDGKCGYIDKTGKIVLEPQFHGAFSCDFYEGLAAVSKDGKCGYIDKTGNLVIELEDDYLRAWNFYDGLARIMKYDGKEGYIDRTGKVVIEPQFKDARDFHDGLADIYDGGKWGYIDKTGKYVWKEK